MTGSELTPAEAALNKERGPFVDLDLEGKIHATYLRDFLVDRELARVSIDGGSDLTIHGELDLSFATALPALTLKNLEVRGALRLESAATPKLELSNVSLATEAGPALDLEHARVEGLVDLSDVRLKSEDAGAPALFGDGMRVGELRMKSLCCQGPIFLRAAVVRGEWNFEDSIATSLDASRIDVGGTVWLQPARVDEDVGLIGARIAHDLEIDPARLGSLAADSSSIGGVVRVLARTPMDSPTARVSLAGAAVGSDLVVGSEDLGVHLRSLDLERARVAGRVLIGHAQIDESLCLRGARIEHDLRLGGASDLSGSKLLASRLSVTGTMGVGWHGSRRPVLVDLSSARVGILDDGNDVDRWPGDRNDDKPLQITGFEYDRIADGAKRVSFKGASRKTLTGEICDWLGRKTRAKDSRRDWLEKQPRNERGRLIYNPQPIEQLARVLAAMGHEIDARDADVWKQRQRWRGDVGWSEKAVLLPWAFLGYGVAPFRVLALWLVVFVASVFVFDREEVMMRGRDSLFRPWTMAQVDSAASPPPSLVYPKFCKYRYALDLVVPFIYMRQEEYWVPREAFRWGAHNVATCLGWVFGTMFLLSITRRIRQRF